MTEKERIQTRLDGGLCIACGKEAACGLCVACEAEAKAEHEKAEARRAAFEKDFVQKVKVNREARAASGITVLTNDRYIGKPAREGEARAGFLVSVLCKEGGAALMRPLHLGTWAGACGFSGMRRARKVKQVLETEFKSPLSIACHRGEGIFEIVE